MSQACMQTTYIFPDHLGTVAVLQVHHRHRDLLGACLGAQRPAATPSLLKLPAVLQWDPRPQDGERRKVGIQGM